MSEPCEEVQKLRIELLSCSSEKDAQINNLSHQMNGMHGDMMRIDGDIRNLTKAVTDISSALDVIAKNTTQISEVIALYQNFKGFGFVVKNIGVVLIGTAALVTAVIFLTGVRFSVGV